ncbi:hypothetical protein HPO96_06180 [Kribbella sandramycini]|uniref:DinB family protein n=1 Tax=Kribbella sandramycini TaxID=60450 RepID=A0A7Y4KY62_9ACTN|nr:hypothetical protein [Kribbella sandramycini]MBB6567570.1 hypothetical protein [Kribbella sandramycini]NOL39826.1 hypothetical protein [Kribbella sandramycini]
MRTPKTSPGRAIELVGADHQLLKNTIAGLSEAELRAPYSVADGPLGHFCESLHDLVGHVLMWDEINLAVLRDARNGRSHWSLGAAWETPELGRALNIGGVESARHIPSELLVQRLDSVHAAFVAEIELYDDAAWADPATGGGFDGGVGALAEYITAPPNDNAFGHAAKHLVAK